MINFNSIGKDLSWFAKRYNALIIEFPKEITLEILRNDDLCSRFDSEKVYKALKLAYDFLTSITAKILSMPKQDKEQIALIEKVLSKIDLLWGLAFKSELHEEGNEYFLSFEKKNLMNDKRRTLPKSYNAAFEAISENGCYVEYFKGDKKAKDYNSCDNGILHFDDNLTALGVYLFIKECAQKRWYWEENKAGGYTKKRQYTPIIDCVEPYRRVDMRIFIFGERMKFNPQEMAAGYSDELKNCFYKICGYVEKNYPECIIDF